MKSSADFPLLPFNVSCKARLLPRHSIRKEGKSPPFILPESEKMTHAAAIMNVYSFLVDNERTFISNACFIF